MTLLELLVFLLLCAALGFLGHLFSSRWGWLLGVIPAFTVISALLFFETRRLYVAIKGVIFRRQG